jgi:hypothetical protein
MNIERLFRIRVVVARFGEMDLLRWWNTKGQLGRLGAMALKRGFPRTHRFAQARSVFSVATQRCTEVWNPPGSVTLWRLPDAIEEEFDAQWEEWLDNAEAWSPFFGQIEAISGTDLPGTLSKLDLVTATDLSAYVKLRRSAESRAVLLPGHYSGTDSDVALLALAFARGEQGALAVPSLKVPDA